MYHGDTLGIKMYIGTMEPSDSVAWHFHPDHPVYVMEGGTLAVLLRRNGKASHGIARWIGIYQPSLI